MTEPVLYAAVKPWERVVSPLRLTILAVAVLLVAVVIVVATRAENRTIQAQLRAQIDSLCIATATVVSQLGFVANDAAIRAGSSVHPWQLEDATEARAALNCPSH